ncbi:hypothetical protein [Pseudomonas sp. BNK-43-a]
MLVSKRRSAFAPEFKAHLLLIYCASHVSKTSDDPEFILKMIEAGEADH